jgi:hypothetical protein
MMLISCNKSEGGDIGPLTTAAKAPGSGASFSADLARELGAGSLAKIEGSGAKPTDSTMGGGEIKAGSGGPKAGGTAVAMTGSGAKVDPGTKAGAGDAKAGTAAAGTGAKADPGTKAGAGDAKAGMAAAGTGAKADPAVKSEANAAKAGTAAAGTGAKADPGTKAGAGDAKAGAAAGSPASEPVSAPASRGAVNVPAEFAAIKLSLLPNWERDVEEAGTFQYVVRIKGTQSSKTFSFRYGYDDPKAPPDRDQYKKYLQDTGALTGDVKDRQRGGAWFLEGSDAAGRPAFRYVVLYGGKRLICYGSLYKDADSNKLGDDRDQTLIQAKQICETLAL